MTTDIDLTAHLPCVRCLHPGIFHFINNHMPHGRADCDPTVLNSNNPGCDCEEYKR